MPCSCSCSHHCLQNEQKAPSRPLSPPVSANLTSPKSRYLCLVSGLRLGSDSFGAGQGDGPSSNAVRLLFSFLAGRIGSGDRDQDLARRVVRVIIAGDSIAEGASSNHSSSRDLHRYRFRPLSHRCHSHIYLGQREAAALLLQWQQQQQWCGAWLGPAAGPAAGQLPRGSHARRFAFNYLPSHPSR